MTVRPTFIHLGNPKGLARHLLRGTELKVERDATLGLQQGPDIGARRGSIPYVRADLQPEMRDALAIHPEMAPTSKHLVNLLSGLRADGREQPRALRAAATHSNNRFQAILVTVSPHISHSLGRALAKTDAARALFDSALRGANSDVMRHLERLSGGQIGYLTIPHFTTRKTLDGQAAPNSHMENVIPNLKLTDDQFRALDLHLNGERAGLDVTFQHSLNRRMEALGADVRMEDGISILAGIPPELSASMSRRTTLATADAQTYAEKQGLKWDALSQRSRSGLIKAGARRTQGSRHDAIGDRAAWIAEAKAIGFEPRDLVDPLRPGLVALPLPQGSMIERSAALRRTAIETLQKAHHMVQAATAAGQAAPSLTAVAGRRSFRAALATATATLKMTVSAMTQPSPALQRLKTLRTTVRRGAEVMLRATTQAAARRVGVELNEWVKAYRLQPILRVGTAVARWATRKVQDGTVTAKAAAVRNAALDTVRAAQAGVGAMRATFAAHRLARVAGPAVAELPMARRAAEVARAMPKAAAAPPEMPLAQRAREMRRAAETQTQKAVGLSQKPSAVAVFTDARAAVVVRQMAAAARIAAEEVGPAAPRELVEYGPQVVAPVGAGRLREEMRAAAEAPVEKTAAVTLGTALLNLHGNPQNALNARARALGSAVARGDMSIRDAASSLHGTWKQVSSESAVKNADPDKVWAAIERRITTAAEHSYTRTMRTASPERTSARVSEQQQQSA